jgi:hypothetical protein
VWHKAPRPIIEERRKYLDAYGKDCADKPVCRSLSLLEESLTAVSVERLSVLVDGPPGGFGEFCKGFDAAPLVHQLRRYLRGYLFILTNLDAHVIGLCDSHLQV